MADETKQTTSVNDPIKDFLGSGGFLKFTDEQPTIEGIYLGCNIEDDPFNPGQQRMIYDIEIDGERKTLTSSSKRLATGVLQANPNAGAFIKITRIGEGFDTQYKVEINQDGMPF
jgi:hypothetical protein